VERCLDYRMYGGKAIQGDKMGNKRYYHTLKEYRGSFKVDMPYTTYANPAVRN